jgi:DNA repair protein RadA/Sms
VQDDLVVVGEVGLTGEVRAVTALTARLREAAQLGFTRAVVPRGNVADASVLPLEAHPVGTVQEALDALLA